MNIKKISVTKLDNIIKEDRGIIPSLYDRVHSNIIYPLDKRMGTITETSYRYIPLVYTSKAYRIIPEDIIYTRHLNRFLNESILEINKTNISHYPIEKYYVKLMYGMALNHIDKNDIFTFVLLKR